MSIRRLKSLIAVAESGGFGAAAKKIFLSQAAVSLQMKALEEELHLKLFDRTKRPPVLNHVGYAMVSKAREIIEAYESLKGEPAGENIISGELAIGAIPSTMSGLMPGALKALRDFYPDLHILISPNQSPDLMELVERKQLDAVVISEPGSLRQPLEFKPVVQEPYILLAPLDCESDDPREILATYPFIRFSRSLWAGRWVENWLREKKISVNELMELGNHEMISSMVYHNLGVSIVPDHCVAPPNPLPLKRILLDPTASPRIIGVLVRSDNPKAPLIDVFYEQIVQYLDKHNDIGCRLARIGKDE